MDLAAISDLSPDEWTTALVDAFEAWTTVDCGKGQHPGIDLRQLRDVACGRSSYDPNGPNVNVVYFTDDGWNPANGDIDKTLAQTTLTFAANGEILDADMALNSARHDFTVTDTEVQYDLVSIARHEAGHFLGIAHSQHEDAIMYYTYSPTHLKRDLTQDDVDAICTIYPPSANQGKVCNPTPHGGLETDCPPKGGCNASGTEGPEHGNGVMGAFFAAALLGAKRLVKKRRVR
jgi:hypothetical protein